MLPAAHRCGRRWASTWQLQPQGRQRQHCCHPGSTLAATRMAADSSRGGPAARCTQRLASPTSAASAATRSCSSWRRQRRCARRCACSPRQTCSSRRQTSTPMLLHRWVKILDPCPRLTSGCELLPGWRRQNACRCAVHQCRCAPLPAICTLSNIAANCVLCLHSAAPMWT